MSGSSLTRATSASRPGSAELAFEVADDWHGQGIATVLLAHLAELAVLDGIATFTAVVLPDNHRMVRVFRDSGFAVDVRSEPGELRVEMPDRLGDDARVRFEDRERVAAAAAAAHVLRPASVAVIGVSPSHARRRSAPRCPASCSRTVLALGLAILLMMSTSGSGSA